MAPGAKSAMTASAARRRADRCDDAVSRRRRLLDEHDRRKHAHPRQMRDSRGKHHEHERPAAADAVERVTEAKAQPVECAAPIVAHEIDAWMAARLQAGILERRELIDRGESERRGRYQRCVRRQPRPRIDDSVQLHVAGKRSQRKRRPNCEVAAQEQDQREREIRRARRGCRIKPDESERRGQHHCGGHELPCGKHDERREPIRPSTFVERVMVKLRGVAGQLRPRADRPRGRDHAAENPDGIEAHVPVRGVCRHTTMPLAESRPESRCDP